jgi:hypothetical protein
MIVETPTEDDNKTNHGVFHLTFKNRIINR